MQTLKLKQRSFFTAENILTVAALALLCACFASPGLRFARFQEPEAVAIQRVTFESLRESLALAAASSPIASTTTAVQNQPLVVPAAINQPPSTSADSAQMRQDEQTKFVAHLIRSHKAPQHLADSLAHMIVIESTKAQYDPIFVAAVIYAESMFKHSAVSHRGAQGLMQIMPETGRYVSAMENIAWGGTRSLKDPKTNLRLGIAYLKYLEAMFNGNRERVLIAYNWGPANMANALRGRIRAPMESVGYARKILTTHRKWKNKFTQLATIDTPPSVG